MYFGWPTNGNPLFLFISFVPLLYVEEFLSKKNNFRYIFLFSFISFLIWNSTTTWWLSYAKRPDGSYAIEAFLIPILFNSLFMSIIFIIYSYIKKNLDNRDIGYIFLICFWILFEKLHLEWELSWPWLNLGNGFSNQIKWIQWYEYTGTLGGTIWIWIVNIGIIKSIIRYKKNKNIIVLYKNCLINVMNIILMIFISIVIYNNLIIKRDYVVTTLLLQPNIDPYSKKMSTKKIIYELKTLINKKIIKKPLLVVAPETLFSLSENKAISNSNYLDINDNEVINQLRNFLKKKSPKTIFITGVELTTLHKKKKFYNSIIQIKTDSKHIYYHHKYKLVPGGENFPYKNILYPILGNMLLDFGGNIIELGKLNIVLFKHFHFNIAPIICYESVFGEYVSNFCKKNANLMVIITNDGWWGKSEGYKQHLYYSRLRAIETRKYIARSSNTGISCFIDEKGNIKSFLPYGKHGVLYQKIYSNSKQTFYIRNGDLLYRICFVITIIIILYLLIYKFIINKNIIN
ncbi:apolipoprotein N-acyltransferase [Blattabacterium cuenoti]|uniref:apolipoprotein N-acyltransferase n=1 Tax=Blattabacterium cuenoti TaxID=1653831 RepID=UPI001EE9C086|nr:apolipoprotein N-acyltransferase [Blattabacterium cuenoti]